MHKHLCLSHNANRTIFCILSKVTAPRSALIPDIAKPWILSAIWYVFLFAFPGDLTLAQNWKLFFCFPVIVDFHYFRWRWDMPFPSFSVSEYSRTGTYAIDLDFVMDGAPVVQPSPHALSSWRGSLPLNPRRTHVRAYVVQAYAYLYTYNPDPRVHRRAEDWSREAGAEGATAASTILFHGTASPRDCLQRTTLRNKNRERKDREGKVRPRPHYELHWKCRGRRTNLAWIFIERRRGCRTRCTLHRIIDIRVAAIRPQCHYDY